MTVLTVYVSSEEEKEEIKKLIKEAIALYFLKYESNIREVDIIKIALKKLIEELKN